MQAVYQAIETKYMGPTNFKGSRVKATAPAGSITLSWDHALNSEDNHRRAAEALAAKFEWNYDQMVQGGTVKGYAFCLIR